MKLFETELFKDIEENDADLLLKCLGASRRKFKKGETIFAQGSVTECLGIVLSGAVIMSHGDVWGNTCIIGNAPQGSVFAEVYACLPKQPMLISVSAAEDAEIIFINVNKALTQCQNACRFHETLARNLLCVCAQRSLQLSRKILYTGARTIRGRLMLYLSEYAKQSGGASFAIPYNRQQLADYLGVDRSAMSAELSKMRRDGLIEYNKNHFWIMNTEEIMDE